MELKIDDVKTWDEKAITSKVGELRAELFNLRMQKAATGTVEKPHTIKIIKKNIARLLTVKSSKKVG